MKTYSSTVENYIKQIYLVHENVDEEPGNVTTSRLSEELDVSPGTVTVMMKSLTEAGLAEYRPREGVRLTEAGTKLALTLIRRHRLIELFLVKVLDLDWSEVHEDAEKMEHVVSDRIVERMEEMLGNPRFGPHGGQIPDRLGEVPDRPLVPLSDLEKGESAQVGVLSESDPEFLKYAAESGLTPGSSIRVVDRAEWKGTITVEIGDDEPFDLAIDTSASILVTPKNRQER